MLRFHLKGNTKRNAQEIDAWKNLANPLIKDNQGKYKSELSKDEKQYIEKKCKNEMERFGYNINLDEGSDDINTLRARLEPLELWDKENYSTLPIRERNNHLRLRQAIAQVEGNL